MCHVLIIEDEWLISDYLAEIAEQAGGTSIAIAVTEVEAVHSARQRLPAIIISDVRILEGSGPKAVQSIISELGEIPVIFITGTPESCQHCAPLGVIFGKPIDARRVIDVFRQLAPV